MFDYDSISSSLCCIEFKMGFSFTNDSVTSFSSCLTNLPVRTWLDKKVKIVAGESLNKISLEKLFQLLHISTPRVDLDLKGIDLRAIKKDKKQLTTILYHNNV